jgi:hypothetical protein
MLSYVNLGLAETLGSRRTAHHGMKWFRSNLIIGSRLALLSLLIQFALSFGHFHGVTARAAPSVQSGLARSEAAGVDARRAIDPAFYLAQQKPASDHDSGQPPSDPCAICATIALANTTLFATPPALPLPTAAAEFSYQTAHTEFVDLNSAGLGFQPRAPPAS